MKTKNIILFTCIITLGCVSKTVKPDDQANAATLKAGRNKQLQQQNNVGHASNDFVYTTPEGKKKRLYMTWMQIILCYFFIIRVAPLAGR